MPKSIEPLLESMAEWAASGKTIPMPPASELSRLYGVSVAEINSAELILFNAGILDADPNTIGFNVPPYAAIPTIEELGAIAAMQEELAYERQFELDTPLEEPEHPQTDASIVHTLTNMDPLMMLGMNPPEKPTDPIEQLRIDLAIAEVRNLPRQDDWLRQSDLLH